MTPRNRSSRRKESREGMRVGLLVLLCAVVLVDAMFYSVVPPLLPTLAREVGLSKAGAGALTAAYAGGMLIGSIPAGIFVSRWGADRALYLGLMLMSITSVGFGFGANAGLLDASRIIQGFAGAFAWTAALTWLTAMAPPDRRGAMIGNMIAAATTGALLGPLVGTIAGHVGRGAVFSAVALLAVGLGAGLKIAAPEHTESRREELGAERLVDSSPSPPPRATSELPAALGRLVIWSGIWLMFVPGVAQAIIALLAPLRLSHLGASATVIGITFLAAAAIESCVSFFAGRVSDRRGRIRPLQLGLVIGAVLLPSLALPSAVAPLATLVVLAGGSVGLFWSPALALFSETAEAIGLSQGVLFALMNVGWAAGQLVGAGVGGELAQSQGDLVALSAAGGLCALTAITYTLRSFGWRSGISAAPVRNCAAEYDRC